MTKTNKVPVQPDDRYSLIKNQKLLSLHAYLRACRKVAGQTGASSKLVRTKPAIKSFVGFEAALVGAAIDLGSGDLIAPDCWPERMIKTVNQAVGRADTVFVGGQAVGGGKGLGVTVRFSGRSQKRQASWHKALERAIVEKQPILFLTMLGGTESTFAEQRGKGASEARRLQVPTINVDGSDVVAVYRVASEAIAHARRGNGPTLIECILERGDDPIEKMTRYLCERGFSLQAAASA